MSMLVAALVFVPLLAVAIACFLWALGRSWPLRNREILASAITGRPGTPALPPRWSLLLTAIFMLSAGIVALSLADHAGGGAWLTGLGILLGLLFLARGAAGYTDGWRRTFPAEPFATLDRRNYSPLAIGLGIGFLLLVVMRFL